MAKATGGFADDTEVVKAGEEKGSLELTDREKAIAHGEDPDAVGAEDAEEEGDEADGTEAEVKDDAASGGGKEAPGSDWIDDDVKELAESYGIDEESLGSFADAADFKRFAAIYEKQLAATPEKADDKGGKKVADPPPAKEEEVVADEDGLDPKWFEDNGYDEQTVKIVKAVTRMQGMAARIEQLEQQLAEEGTRREREAFDREIGTLGDRYGAGDKLTKAQKEARSKLADAVEVVSQTLAKRGEKASRAVVLKRAELVAFGDEILAEEREKQKEALSQSVKKQSAKRRSVGRNTKPPARRERPGEANSAKAIANLPELVAAFEAAEE